MEGIEREQGKQISERRSDALGKNVLESIYVFLIILLTRRKQELLLYMAETNELNKYYYSHIIIF